MKITELDPSIKTLLEQFGSNYLAAAYDELFNLSRGIALEIQLKDQIVVGGKVFTQDVFGSRVRGITFDIGIPVQTLINRINETAFAGAVEDIELIPEIALKEGMYIMAQGVVQEMLKTDDSQKIQELLTKALTLMVRDSRSIAPE
ncbi:hypothetical protein A3A66_01620 [Microgenomates group bacterium RIFCSPLOWO2_01_FULL_46_13]|nr:MAG: hypothetical protein A2783_00780 [Microgenomates group bacterium RIFCSPHIGHO2_01_FULL_45_11]OGV94694.1 MAG: hypothetical protein A3A66_01620 [Microgenomates group bacterium RIFCSPLOWO2_01_FULL_46_13]